MDASRVLPISALAALTGLATGCCGGGSCMVPALHFGFRPIEHRVPRSPAIPDRYPVGSVVREHYSAMQTNAEATDFVIHRNDFVGETAELTPDGRDHVLEIAARMRAAPFPVLVERSENNYNPGLDADRRSTVALVLADLGNPDAEQRTILSPAYGRGISSMEGEVDYYRYIFTRGGNNNFGNNGGGGGFGGGGGGFGFGGR